MTEGIGAGGKAGTEPRGFEHAGICLRKAAAACLAADKAASDLKETAESTASKETDDAALKAALRACGGAGPRKAGEPLPEAPAGTGGHWIETAYTEARRNAAKTADLADIAIILADMAAEAVVDADRAGPVEACAADLKARAERAKTRAGNHLEAVRGFTARRRLMEAAVEEAKQRFKKRRGRRPGTDAEFD